MIDLPPKWIVRAAKEAIRKAHTWDAPISIFCAYYGISNMICCHDEEQVPKGAVACYRPGIGNTEGLCYTKNKAVSAIIIFHEFGHHINNFLFKHTLSGKANEAFATIFADELTMMWEGFT